MFGRLKYKQKLTNFTLFSGDTIPSVKKCFEMMDGSNHEENQPRH
jgi:hypothetical protein